MERGPQRLMAMDDRFERAPHRFGIERPGHADDGRAVVGRVAGLELVEEPERFLAETERQSAIARRWRKRSNGQSIVAIRGRDSTRLCLGLAPEHVREESALFS